MDTGRLMRQLHLENIRMQHIVYNYDDMRYVDFLSKLKIDDKLSIERLERFFYLTSLLRKLGALPKV